VAEVVTGETTDLAATLVDWAQKNRLAATGIKVIWRRHAWDTQYIPHANRGYFPFWEKIRSAG
jgi:hypothetical protein